MPILYWAHPVLRTFHIIYSGVIDAPTLLRFFDRFEPEFQHYTDFDEYCELTAVTGVRFSDKDLHDIYDVINGIYSRHGSAKNIAFVAPHEPARTTAQGFVDFAARQPQGPVVKRFDSREAALRMLGIPVGQRHHLRRH